MKKQEEINEKKSFAEKHPKLNLLYGFLLLIGIGAIIASILKLIGNEIIKLINWISTLSSTLDAVVIVALITGLVSITGVILSSIVAKSLEYKRIRREYLTQKREKPYSDFIEMMYKVQQSSKEGHEYPKEQMEKDLMDFSKQITLWGSPKVVNQWGKFKENALDKDVGFKNLLLTEDMMNAMRKDLGTKKVKQGNLLIFTVNDIKQTLKNMKNKSNK